MYLKKSMFVTSSVVFLLAFRSVPSLAVGMDGVKGMDDMPGMDRMESVEFCYGPECPLPPERWADEFPDCSGKTQSPVDIFGTKRNRNLRPIRFHYRPSELVVKNNGHTTEVEYEEGSPDYIRVDGEQCDLLQFHFHTRSEHGIGGNSFPMEAHLVHQCESGRLAVIGVMMHYLSETPNKALNKALMYAPFDEVSGEYIIDTVLVDDVRVNARDLLPRKRDYYTYEGSLTTPPCSEIVDWYVMRKSVGISKQQVETFKGILADTSPDKFPFNNRPLQNLNDRAIERRNRLPKW